jgi:hypothetical protein
VDNEIAGGEGREFGEESVGAFLAFGAANKAVAQHVLLGEDGKVGGGEAVVERQDDEGGCAFGREALRLLPVGGEGERACLVLFQQAGEALACAGGIAGDDDLAPIGLALVVDMDGDGVVDVGALCTLRREIARGIDAEIEHRRAFRLVERRGDVDRVRGDGGDPFAGGGVELIGGERAIASGSAGLRRDAVGMVIADRLESLLDRAGNAAVAHDERLAAQMFDERHEAFLEQG